MRVKPAPRSPEDVPVQIEFEDNRLLPSVFGEHDRYLARIEQRLGVSLHNRGNIVSISGPPDAAATARDALQRLRRGARLTPYVDGDTLYDLQES